MHMFYVGVFPMPMQLPKQLVNYEKYESLEAGFRAVTYSMNKYKIFLLSEELKKSRNTLY